MLILVKQMDLKMERNSEQTMEQETVSVLSSIDLNSNKV